MADETLNDLPMDMTGTGYYSPETPAPRAKRSAEIEAANAATVALSRQLFVARAALEARGDLAKAQNVHAIARWSLWAAAMHEVTATHIMNEHGDYVADPSQYPYVEDGEEFTELCDFGWPIPD